MHWYYGTPMGWGGFVMMGLTTLLFLGGIAALIVVLARRPGDGRGDSASRILDERLARGEIDAEEYERIRKTLRA